MSELRIIIRPYKGNIIIPIEDSFSLKICDMIKKIKTKQRSLKIEIPEIGYCGMVLLFGNSVHIYINNEKIFFTKDNITEIFVDKKKRINKILLKKALPKYGRELNYFFEVLDTNKDKIE